VSYASKFKKGISKSKPAVNSVKPLIGTKKDSSASNLKSVGNVKWLFISRLSTDVVVDDLVSYMKDAGITRTECIELQPKYNTYKSFKIGLSSIDFERAFCAGFWPEGSLVCEYTPPRHNMLRPTLKSRVFLGKRNQ
jgi:hypothetical protein